MMSKYELHPQEEKAMKLSCGHSVKKITGEVHDETGPLVHYIIALDSDGRAFSLFLMYNTDVFQNVNDHIMVSLGVAHAPDGGHGFSILDPENRGKKDDILILGREEFKALFSGRVKKRFWEIADGIMANDPRINREPDTVH